MRKIYYCPANTEVNPDKWVDFLCRYGNLTRATRETRTNNEVIDSLEDENGDMVIVSLGTVGSPKSGQDVLVGRGVWECVDGAEYMVDAYLAFYAIDKMSQCFVKVVTGNLSNESDYKRWGYIRIVGAPLNPSDLFGNAPTAGLTPTAPTSEEPTVLSPGVCAYYFNKSA